MSDFEIERRAANVVEAQFETIAEADRFAAWLDISGRARWVMDEDFEVERRVSNVVEVQFLDIAEASLFAEWVDGEGRKAFQAWLKNGAETIEGAQ